MALPAICAALFSVAMPGVSAADEDDAELANTPVRQRSYPEFAPTGIGYHGLLFYPSLLAGVQFDSNVFASSQNPVDDLALILAPELEIRADRGTVQHSLEIGAKHYDYRRFNSEDRTEAHARLRSSRQFSSDLKLDTALEAARRFQLRGDSFSPLSSAEPIAYHDLRAETVVTKTFNRLGVAVGGGVRRLSYEDGETLSGDPLDQSYRDGTILTASLKPFYDISPGYRAYTRLEVNSRDYEGTGSLNRDSRGLDARAGLEFALTPLLFGFIEGGWLHQTYSNELIPDAQGLSAKGKLSWLATPLMTVSLIGSRSTAEMAAPDIEARIDVTAGLQVDYELRRDLIAGFEALYKHEDFTGSPRRDEVYQLSAQIDYTVNSYFDLGFKYSYFERHSNDLGFSFDRHVVMLNVTAQY